MCRLFGMIADSPVSLEDPILKGKKSLINLSHKHRDGWGVGYFNHSSDDYGIHLIKAPRPAYRDAYFVASAKQIVSSLVIAHLRDAKIGEVAIQNTQPFCKEGWIFAHNGTIENYKAIEKELAGTSFIGDTDSERYFYLILDRIRREGDVKRGIFSAINWLESNGFTGGKNFLLSDGKRLYAYRHGRSLFYIKKEVPVNSRSGLKGAAVRVLCLPVKKAGTVIIASEEMTNENWHEVPEDHLVVVDKNLKVSIEPIETRTAVCC